MSATSKEVITKPSCVKEIKNLGYNVRNIAFGEAFSVILTGRTKKNNHFQIRNEIFIFMQKIGNGIAITICVAKYAKYSLTFTFTFSPSELLLLIF